MLLWYWWRIISRNWDAEPFILSILIPWKYSYSCSLIDLSTVMIAGSWVMHICRKTILHFIFFIFSSWYHLASISFLTISMLCRTTLGFWAGHRNSKIRVILARAWENDTELDISNNRINRATGLLVYQKRFYKTKFCICPGGSQVNSARIADSIHYGCIPGKCYNYNYHTFSQ